MPFIVFLTVNTSSSSLCSLGAFGVNLLTTTVCAYVRYTPSIVPGINQHAPDHFILFIYILFYNLQSTSENKPFYIVLTNASGSATSWRLKSMNATRDSYQRVIGKTNYCAVRCRGPRALTGS